MAKSPSARVADIRAALRQAGERFLTAVAQAYPGETLYGFLFEVSAEGFSAHGAAATEEGLRRFADRVGEPAAEYRWGSTEDAWIQEPAAAFDAVNRLLARAERENLYEAYDGTLESVCLGVLKEMDSNGAFGVGPARDRVAVGLCHVGGDNSEKEFLAWAKQVNPPAVFRRLKAEYRLEAVPPTAAKPVKGGDSPLAARARSMLATFAGMKGAFAARKAAAERQAVRWVYSDREIASVKPVQAERSGHPFGVPAASRPAAFTHETGLDARGRVVAVRYHLDDDLTAEEFWDWSGDPVEVAGYDVRREPLTLQVAERDGDRVVRHFQLGPDGTSRRKDALDLTYELYRWEQGRLVRAETWAFDLKKLRPDDDRPFEIAKLTYAADGTLLKVRTFPDEEKGTRGETTYELRGGTPRFRHAPQ